jgi:hypothetical protein
MFGRTDPDSNATEKVFNTFYNKLKVAIEDNSPPGVADINAKMSQLIPVQNAVIRRIPVAERNGAISLLDMIGLVGSISHPAALVPTALEMGSRSGVVGNILSKVARPAAELGRIGIPSAPRLVTGSTVNTISNQDTTQ